MKHYLNILISAVGLSALVLFSGCQSTGSSGARRIDPSGPETITTIHGLDTQDATDAAGELAQSLLEAGILGKDGRPSIIAISRYVNNTGQQIDRDRVIKKIRVSLNKAGVAQTLTTMGPTGTTAGAEDPLAVNVNEGSTLIPEYSLTYKLLSVEAVAGKTKQYTYIFQMSLTDIQNGLAVWEDERRITKQGKKASVGW